MTNEQAKETLRLYRPGTADATDPSFAEALALCERDTELKKWFAEHCALYAALRAKFKQIVPPEGLKEQIIAERRVHTTPVWQRAVIFAGVAAILVLVAFEFWPEPGEPHDFPAYRSSMGSLAQRVYQMDKYTSDLGEVRAFFQQTNALADYVLPENLGKNAKTAGCVATTWQGKKVSMICFATGRPLKPSDKSDLWLFITDNATTKDTPTSATPSFKKVDELMTASWTVGNRTYVLATRGDEKFLGKFL